MAYPRVQPGFKIHSKALRALYIVLLTVLCTSHTTYGRVYGETGLVKASQPLVHRKLLQTGQAPTTGDSTPTEDPTTNATTYPAPAPTKGTTTTGTSASNALVSAGLNATGSSNNTGAYGCPKITLRLDTIEVYDPAVNDPTGLISVQCYTRNGQQFPPVTFYALAASVRSSLGARYTPNADVAELWCGQEVSCRISVGHTGTTLGNGTTSVGGWRELVEGGCWFDYRHFTQLSYREQMSAWTCNRPPTRYTLECVECAQPNFPWDVALASGGAPLSEAGNSANTLGFNSTMIVVSIVVCSVAVVLVGLGLFVRHKRRTQEHDRRMMEMIEQAREARQRPRGFKPPAMFVIGSDTASSPPSDGYKGPIVVLNVAEQQGDGDEDADGDGLPAISIARPERPFSSSRSGKEGSRGEGGGNGGGDAGGSSSSRYHQSRTSSRRHHGGSSSSSRRYHSSRHLSSSVLPPADTPSSTENVVTSGGGGATASPLPPIVDAAAENTTSSVAMNAINGLASTSNNDNNGRQTPPPPLPPV